MHKNMQSEISIKGYKLIIINVIIIIMPLFCPLNYIQTLQRVKVYKS